MQTSTKQKIRVIATAILTVAAALGSTLLTHEQREAVLQFLETLLAVL